MVTHAAKFKSYSHLIVSLHLRFAFDAAETASDVTSFEFLWAQRWLRFHFHRMSLNVLRAPSFVGRSSLAKFTVAAGGWWSMDFGMENITKLQMTGDRLGSLKRNFRVFCCCGRLKHLRRYQFPKMIIMCWNGWQAEDVKFVDGIPTIAIHSVQMREKGWERAISIPSEWISLPLLGSRIPFGRTSHSIPSSNWSHWKLIRFHFAFEFRYHIRHRVKCIHSQGPHVCRRGRRRRRTNTETSCILTVASIEVCIYAFITHISLSPAMYRKVYVVHTRTRWKYDHDHVSSIVGHGISSRMPKRKSSYRKQSRHQYARFSLSRMQNEKEVKRHTRTHDFRLTCYVTDVFHPNRMAHHMKRSIMQRANSGQHSPITTSLPSAETSKHRSETLAWRQHDFPICCLFIFRLSSHTIPVWTYGHTIHFAHRLPLQLKSNEREKRRTPISSL